jgi:hypothetical protein
MQRPSMQVSVHTLALSIHLSSNESRSGQWLLHVVECGVLKRGMRVYDNKSASDRRFEGQDKIIHIDPYLEDQRDSTRLIDWMKKSYKMLC